MKRTLLAFVVLSVAASCQQVNFEKTNSGMVYKIFRGKGGDSIKAGGFIKFNMQYAMPEKDTILNSTYGKVPGFAQVDTGARYAYSFMELLPMMREGDSAEFSLSIDTLKKRGAFPDYNSTFKRGDQIKCKLTIIKVFKNEQEIQADYNKEIELEKTREIASLQNYIDKKGIKAQKTKNGAFVEIKTPGDATLKADSGKQVSVLYKGTLQDKGTIFDTNMDSSKGHAGAYTFVVGRDPVVQGWQESLPYFGKGGKGTLYIPAMLGYGMQGSSGAIPPYANLVFDVEITDVKDAPPAQPEQGMQNQLTPEQMKQLQEQMMKQRQQQSQPKK